MTNFNTVIVPLTFSIPKFLVLYADIINIETEPKFYKERDKFKYIWYLQCTTYTIFKVDIDITYNKIQIYQNFDMLQYMEIYTVTKYFDKVSYHTKNTLIISIFFLEY